MSTVMPAGLAGDKFLGASFPTNAEFTRRVAEGQTSVKDMASSRYRCIVLRPDGRHCGEFMILQGGSGWDLQPSKVMAPGTTFVDGKDASFGDATWRCMKKHTKEPQFDPEAKTRIMSVEERAKFELVAKRVLDPKTGTLVGEQVSKDDIVQAEKIVETTVTKDKISFDVSLDELTNVDLLNELLKKISSALDQVPTSNMGEAKKLMKIQEAVENLKK